MYHLHVVCEQIHLVLKNTLISEDVHMYMYVLLVFFLVP